MRELPGKSPGTSGEVRGTSGEVRGLSKSSGEPDSPPATRRVCLQAMLFDNRCGVASYVRSLIRNTLSTAENAMTSSERPSPEVDRNHF